MFWIPLVLQSYVLIVSWANGETQKVVKCYWSFHYTDLLGTFCPFQTLIHDHFHSQAYAVFLYFHDLKFETRLGKSYCFFFVLSFAFYFVAMKSKLRRCLSKNLVAEQKKDFIRTALNFPLNLNCFIVQTFNMRKWWKMRFSVGLCRFLIRGSRHFCRQNALSESRLLFGRLTFADAV